MTGRGSAFTRPVFDLSEMARPGGSTELGTHFDPLLRRLASFPKPLLGAVNGLAVGFGATILLHCDVVVIDGGRPCTPALRRPRHVCRSRQQLAPAPPRRHAVGVVDGPVRRRTHGPDEAVHHGFALAKAPAGRAVDEALVMAAQMAAHTVTALVANKALLRHGWPEAVDEVWEREKASMLAVAEEARSRSDGSARATPRRGPQRASAGWGASPLLQIHHPAGPTVHRRADRQRRVEELGEHGGRPVAAGPGERERLQRRVARRPHRRRQGVQVLDGDRGVCRPACPDRR